MWNTELFIAEMIGTLILAFGISGVLYFTKSKSYTLTGFSSSIFKAFAIGGTLMIAVYTAANLERIQINTAHGYVNPAAALMDAIGKSDYSLVLSAISGELIGAILGFTIIKILVFLSTNDKEIFKINLSKNEKLDWKGSIFGEILGTIIFFSSIAIAVFGGTSIPGIVVGLGLIVTLVIFGDRFALMLNPAIGFTAFLESFFIKIKNISTNEIGNTLMKISTDMAMASSIGAVVCMVMK
ncbi:MAG: aquaporin [Mycoplasmatales bacterium]|nr:aquaporin [Mycoplasmatales bacterium]